MAKHDHAQLECWVDGRLAALDPDSEWRPNTTKALAHFRERSESGRNRRWIWVMAAVLVACAGAMVLPGTRVLAERCIGACSEAGIRIWQSLRSPALVAAVQAPEASRNAAPDFTLNDASGTPVRLSDFRGKVVLLNFWATWCPPCKIEIPWFIEFQRTYGERDFVVLGVSLGGWNPVQPFMAGGRINYRVMIDNGKVAELYGVESLPMTLLIDKSGRIASTHAGLASQDVYRAGIEALLKESRRVSALSGLQQGAVVKWTPRDSRAEPLAIHRLQLR